MSKKKSIIIIILIGILLIPSFSVNALSNAQCKKKFKDAQTCNANSSCVWNTSSKKCVKFNGCSSYAEKGCKNIPGKCNYENDKCSAKNDEVKLCSDYTKSPCGRQIGCIWNRAAKKCQNFQGCSGLSRSDCNHRSSKCEWTKKSGQSKKQCNTKDGVVTPETAGITSPTDINFCASTAKIWKIVGRVLLIFKIIVPVLLIILGVIDFSQAIISNKDDQVTKAAKKLFFRAISGVIIFFLPIIASLVTSLAFNFTSEETKADYEVCKTCVLKPGSCDTSKDSGNNMLK